LTLVLGIALWNSSALAQTQELREGDRAFEAGKLQKAARAYDRAIRKAPRRVPAEAYGKRAAVFLLLKQYEEGLSFITQRAQLYHPREPAVLEQKALLYWALGSKPDAIRIAEKVVRAAPTAYSNQKLIGQFYAGREPDKAVAAFESYLRYRPDELVADDVLPRLRLGFAYLALERAADAENQFNIVIDEHEKSPHAQTNARNGLCATYVARKAYDRAIRLCETIVSEPKNVDPSGSAWYNLGRAYLAKRRIAKARIAAVSYLRLREGAAKGYMLLGDTYFAERDWPTALRQYLRAEEENPRGWRVTQLGVKLGITYRRLGEADKAVAKLSKAVSANPDSVTLTVELGRAYLDTGDDRQAYDLVRKLMAKGASSAQLHVVAARAQYNRGRPDKAREQFLKAYELSPKSSRIRQGLVQSIVLEAHRARTDGDNGSAARLLAEARAVNPKASLVNRNLAVLAIERGDCDAALEPLEAFGAAGVDTHIYHRLSARAELCRKSPDPARATKHFEEGEKAARRMRDNLVLAELYIEWAPSLFDSDIDGAIDKLEQAIQFAARDKSARQAASRNLALALLQRAANHLGGGKLRLAEQDLVRAKESNKLRSVAESSRLDLLNSLLRAERGQSVRLPKRGGEYRAELFSPKFRKTGSPLVRAYIRGRSTKRKVKLAGASELVLLQRRVKGRQAEQLADIAAATWASVAVDAHRAGDKAGAQRALKTAGRLARSKALKRNLRHNRVVHSLSSSTAAELEKLDGRPPEALVNVGILRHRAKDIRGAWQAWVAAKKKGVDHGPLEGWIESVQRVMGYR
jgi:tetratricopeptide (TPR) repeat protein